MKVFKYSVTDLYFQLGNETNFDRKSEFDVILEDEWDKLQASGLFRYIWKQIPTKILPGKYQFIAQLNPDRAEKRRKPQSIKSLSQLYNPNEFNFTNANEKEIIISLEPWWSQNDPKDHQNQNIIMINISPLEYAHILIIPQFHMEHPQKITLVGLRLALDILLLSKSSDFRVGFNSLCAYASVNHQHFHAYYLKHRLHIEFMALENVIDGILSKTVDYPGMGFVFILKDTEGLEKFIENVYKLTSHLQENDVAHNLFITRGSTKNLIGHFDSIRLFVWARTPSYGAKASEAFNPALCELAGHFPIKSEPIYEFISEDSISEELSEICREPYEQLYEQIFNLYTTSEAI